MASTITQVIAFRFATPPDAPASLAKAVRDSGYPGIHHQFFGRGVHNPELNYWLINRDSNSPPVEVIPLLHKHLDSGLKPTLNYTVSFLRQPLEKSFSAPVTEIIYAMIKDETDVEKFSEISDLSLVPTEEYPGCTGSSWNFAKESPRSLFMIIGWDKIETHEAFKKTEEFRVTTEPWIEGALLETVTVDYFKFEGLER